MDLQSNNENSVDVSVILPALDEERTIGECITKILKVFHDNAINGEIIVADSSTDRTSEIAASLGAKVIHSEKSGYGNAYLTGFRHARGLYIVMGLRMVLILSLDHGSKEQSIRVRWTDFTVILEIRFLRGCSTSFSILIILIPIAGFARSPAKPLTGYLS
jgi:glycosyltransferase involved in cell wall biosynthesis